MVRVGSAIKIQLMTINTQGRCTFKTTSVTTDTIYSCVGSGQRKLSTIVIKSIFGITCWVAGKTSIVIVIIATHPGMKIIGLRILVTTDTGKFCIVGRIFVAFGTLHPHTVVFP